MRAALLVAVVGCNAMPDSSPRPPTITTGPVSWRISQQEYSFHAVGTAPVTVSDTAHTYLLVYRVRWDKRLDPNDSTDLTITSLVTMPEARRNVVEISDWKSRCGEYSVADCLRRASDPVARLELVGWSRLERP